MFYYVSATLAAAAAAVAASPQPPRVINMSHEVQMWVYLYSLWQYYVSSTLAAAAVAASTGHKNEIWGPDESIQILLILISWCELLCVKSIYSFRQISSWEPVYVCLVFRAAAAAAATAVATEYLPEY